MNSKYKEGDLVRIKPKDDILEASDNNFFEDESVHFGEVLFAPNMIKFCGLIFIVNYVNWYESNDCYIYRFISSDPDSAVYGWLFTEEMLQPAVPIPGLKDSLVPDLWFNEDLL